MVRLEHLEDIFARRVEDLEDVLNTSWRGLEDVLKTYGQDEYIGLDQDVLKTSSEDVRLRRTYSSWWRRLLKTKTKDVFKTSSRPLHQDECLLGSYLSWFKKWWKYSTELTLGLRWSEKVTQSCLKESWCSQKNSHNFQENSQKRVIFGFHINFTKLI